MVRIWEGFSLRDSHKPYYPYDRNIENMGYFLPFLYFSFVQLI
jgi:hypothetical protein